ncbi:MAG: hypothetical protein SVM86_07940 [Candidatus Cloacimonadota bacterium]|nr:hypothetical protein [Candidatus Cloacimonadota bacterium]
MLEALASKVVSGIMAFGMMLVASTEGNKAKFSDLNASYLNNGIIIETKLIDSFQNDFEQIFKSGKTIIIDFNIEIKQNNEVLKNDSFAHSVTYDPMQQIYQVEIEEQEETIFTDKYRMMLEKISIIEYYLWEKVTGPNLEVKIEASLRNLQLSTDKNYNLMLLWRYRKPTIKQKLRIGKNELEN